MPKSFTKSSIHSIFISISLIQLKKTQKKLYKQLSSKSSGERLVFNNYRKNYLAEKLSWKCPEDYRHFSQLCLQ